MKRHSPVGRGGVEVDVRRSGRCSGTKEAGGGSVCELYIRAWVVPNE